MMTVDEKRKALDEYDCESRSCRECPAKTLRNYGMYGMCDITGPNVFEISNARVHELYHLLIETVANAEPAETTPEDVNHDPVNHPSHYCRDDAIESIDEMAAVFGKEAVKSFCLCNVWKYRYRAADKGGEEDLKKSDWYMRKYIELSKEEKHD